VTVSYLQDILLLREDLEHKVETFQSAALTEEEARKAWEGYECVTRTISHELCEQLRLILEPTQASKLR